MIGDYLIPTGPDYGVFKRGCFGALIHDLECPRSVNVRAMTGPGSYPANAGVSPHTISGMREVAQLLDETHAGAHCGSPGNQMLVGFEVTGYAKWTEPEWLEDISNLKNQARAVANLWRRNGWKLVDLQWGSGAELIEAARRYRAGLPPAAPRLWTHNDVSEFLKGTNHWDPGLGFPARLFLQLCREYFAGAGVGGGTTAPTTPTTPTTGGAEPQTWIEKLMAENTLQDLTDAVRNVVRTELTAQFVDHSLMATGPFAGVFVSDFLNLIATRVAATRDVVGIFTVADPDGTQHGLGEVDLEAGEWKGFASMEQYQARLDDLAKANVAVVNFDAPVVPADRGWSQVAR